MGLSEGVRVEIEVYSQNSAASIIRSRIAHEGRYACGCNEKQEGSRREGSSGREGCGASSSFSVRDGQASSQA